jgi:phosphatidylserine/phosphatidylglycerophosphate/cardiolipin synthase-like enzyme
MLIRYLLFLICSGLFLSLSGCQQENSKNSKNSNSVPEIIRPPSLPQDPLIKAYFNHNQAQGAEYTDPYRQKKRPGDNLEDIIIQAISSANETIEIAVQEFRLPQIAQALAEKQQNGVQVRVILEDDYRRSWSEYSQSEVAQFTEREKSRYQAGFNFIDLNQDGNLSSQEINQRDAIAILEKAGIPILDDTADGTKGSGLMHHKFMIVDQEMLLVTSANFTLSGIHGDLGNPNTMGNANNLITLESQELASFFLEEFNLMWGDGVGGKPDSVFGVKKGNREFPPVLIGNSVVAVHFSPTSKTHPWEDTSNGFISRKMTEADQSLNFALFVFSDQKLANKIAERYQQGVKVRGLIDSGFVYRYYSEALDMMGIELARNCKIEKDNSPWESAISTVGTSKLPDGDKLHHKFAVFDQNTVVTGSHNWSAAANYNNDETVLVIQNPMVAAHYEREFERLYDRAILGIPQWLERRVKSQKEKCSQLSYSPF